MYVYPLTVVPIYWQLLFHIYLYTLAFFSVNASIIENYVADTLLHLVTTAPQTEN